ncbi:MAG: putative toxin-antitoxin system toxin component, PIN family [Candidatus Pacearchaeota archaeon]|jgi:putative PIN family toxin of toxin-antitoxin system
MKIVVDTNFLVSATQWDYSVSYKLLQKLIRNNTEIFTTKEILEEFTKVLTRDFLYNEEDTQNILNKVLQFLTIVIPINKIEVVKDDADDNKIIECAIESGAEYILSYDNHLLNLKEYQGIKIIKPEEAFNLI